jgi:hypothetical protein
MAVTSLVSPTGGDRSRDRVGGHCTGAKGSQPLRLRSGEHPVEGLVANRSAEAVQKANRKAQARTPTYIASRYVVSVVELCQQMNISERELERRAGVPHSTWMRIKRTPNARVLRETDAKFRAVLGEQLPVPDFDNERRRFKGLQNLAKFGHRVRMKVAKRRAAQARALRHPHISERHKEAISVAAKQRHRLRPELGRQLGAFQESSTGRALTGLRLKLAWWSATERRRRSPRPLPANRGDIPQRHVIRRWATDYASRNGVDQGHVLDIWEAWLEKVGLWSPGGRRRSQERYRLVTAMMATWPSTPTGKLQRGFWTAAAWRVRAGDNDEPPDPECLRVWYRAYQRDLGLRST